MKNDLVRIWTITLFIKLVLAALIPLANDESYYWVWSHNLRLSYYDHPPLIAWVLSLSHFLEPLGQAIRWPVVIIGHLTPLVLYPLIHHSLTRERQILWFLFLCLNPLAGWGSLIAVPDTLLVFFYSLSVYLTSQYFHNPTLKKALLLGASLGLGFLAKYQIVLFIPALLTYLCLTPNWKRIKIQHVLAACAVGLVFSLPVLIWNYQNNFDSFNFQLNHGFNHNERSWKWPVNYVLSQIGLIFPILFWLAIKGFKRNTLLYVFGWFPVAFFFISSFRAPVEGNWPVMGYPIIISLGVLMSRTTHALRVNLGIWLVCFIIVLSEVFYPWIPSFQKSKKTEEFYTYQILEKVAESYTPFYASSFQMASMISYANKKFVYKLPGIGRKDFYDYLPTSPPPKSKFFLAVRPGDNLPKELEPYKLIQSIKISQEFLLLEIERL